MAKIELFLQQVNCKKKTGHKEDLSILTITVCGH